MRGRPRSDDLLTPREWEVLDLLRRGLTNEQIAAHLGISFSGAKYHVSEIITKLGVETREEAARVAPPRRVGMWAGLLSGISEKAALSLAVLAVSLLVLGSYLLATYSYTSSPTLAPEPVGPDGFVPLQGPFSRTVLLTKFDPINVGDAAEELAALTRVSSIAEFEMIQDQVNLLVIDNSIADEITGTGFLSKQIREGRAVISLNVCFDELHGSLVATSGPSAPVITERAPDGTERKVLGSNGSRCVFTDQYEAENYPYFAFRRYVPADQPQIRRESFSGLHWDVFLIDLTLLNEDPSADVLFEACGTAQALSLHETAAVLCDTSPPATRGPR
jgi:DNA-binding CsgD family transcriptional regulator